MTERGPGRPSLDPDALGVRLSLRVSQRVRDALEQSGSISTTAREVLERWEAKNRGVDPDEGLRNRLARTHAAWRRTAAKRLQTGSLPSVSEMWRALLDLTDRDTKGSLSVLLDYVQHLEGLLACRVGEES